MACNDCSDINPCTDCQEANPCYGDCGCLNPTTFDCVTKPGSHPDINVTDDMTGKQVLDAINDVIANLVLGIPPSGDDKYVKITSNDTTANYLWDKLAVSKHIGKTVINPSGNEILKLTFKPEEAVSTDPGNILDIGTDGSFRVIAPSVVNNVSVTEGTGVSVTGSGTVDDPYVISINPSITALRSCFDGVWHDITLVATGNANVVYVSGAPKYRIRHDGTIEFKGTATYNVAFGNYSSANRKFSITVGNIPSTCVTLTEQAGTQDLKSIQYIDVPQASADQIVQQYGYIIKKSTQNINIDFQSAFTNATSKSIVVSFDGAVSHPNL